jgi:hypothetical protein
MRHRIRKLKPRRQKTPSCGMSLAPIPSRMNRPSSIPAMPPVATSTLSASFVKEGHFDSVWRSPVIPVPPTTTVPGSFPKIDHYFSTTRATRPDRLRCPSSCRGWSHGHTRTSIYPAPLSPQQPLPILHAESDRARKPRVLWYGYRPMASRGRAEEEIARLPRFSHSNPFKPNGALPGFDRPAAS